LKAALNIAAVSVLTTGYGFGVEPFRLRIQRHSLPIVGWSGGSLSIAALADIHACRPWMGPERIVAIVEATHALTPDLIVLLGDYPGGHPFVTGPVTSSEWAEPLSKLKAPLGVYAILGNHDWWVDHDAQRSGQGPTVSHRALADAGIPVLENNAVRLLRGKQPFWLAGLGDQIALLPGKRWKRPRLRGVDDLPSTLAQVTDDAPVILLAHEPDIFPRVPGRVSVILSGHTHGGQIRLFGYSPVVPSRFGNRYAYGHITEQTAAGGLKHLVVSGGLGCSIVPVRFGVPPEITLVTLSGPDAHTDRQL
jgi:predicted MPP superfamily phosphohydrolase